MSVNSQILRSVSLIPLLALCGVAHAQDNGRIDAHGFTQVPDDGHPLDLMVVWRPQTQVPMSGGVEGLLEFSKAPLVLYSQVDEDFERYELLDNAFGANLGASFGAHPRFGVTVTMPLWFTSSGYDPVTKVNEVSGLALGDMRLAVPIGLKLPDPGVEGFGFSLVPFADLPTGNQDRFLGSEDASAGAIVATGYTDTDFHLTANLGFEALKRTELRNIASGPTLLVAFGGGYMLTDQLAARAELNFRPVMYRNAVVGTEAPGELLVSVRSRYPNGVSWVAGGALPWTRGASAPIFRFFAGVGYTFGPPVEPDTDQDGLVDKIDLCPDVPEGFNGYVDDDGCPDQLANLTVIVVDPEGNRVQNATVEVDGQPYAVDMEGVLRLEDLIPGTSPFLEVSAPYMITETVSDLTLVEGENERTVALEWIPGRVKIITRSNKGAIVDSRVRLTGPSSLDPQQLGDDGEEIFELPPGQWTAIISAEAFGTERRDFKINPGETALIVIEVILQPTLVKLTEKEVVILEQVHFDFDKDTIKAESLPLLDQVAFTILDNPHILAIEVQGHTDSKGSDLYNQDLSQRRVNSVMRYLIEKGVAADRLVAVGYGEAKPIASNSTSAGRAKNRRVQFVIMETEASRAAKQQGATAPEGTPPVESPAPTTPTPGGQTP